VRKVTVGILVFEGCKESGLTAPLDVFRIVDALSAAGVVSEPVVFEARFVSIGGGPRRIAGDLRVILSPAVSSDFNNLGGGNFSTRRRGRLKKELFPQGDRCVGRPDCRSSQGSRRPLSRKTTAAADFNFTNTERSFDHSGDGARAPSRRLVRDGSRAVATFAICRRPLHQRNLGHNLAS